MLDDDNTVWVEDEPEENEYRYALLQDPSSLDGILLGFGIAILVGFLFAALTWP